jgi:hypothetical protein
MKRLTVPALFLLALMLADAPASAQPPQQRVSPHETIGAVIDPQNRNTSRVTIVYGRPYSKAPRGGEVRKIWGTLVPHGRAWRLGADEATLLITQQPLAFGETTIPAGAYTLYMVPDENGAKLAFSKTLGGWGVPVDEKNDLARVDMKKEALETPVDQLTMAVARNPDGGGIIRVMWESTQFSVPFTIKK